MPNEMNRAKPDVVVHTFDTSTQKEEAETGISLKYKASLIHSEFKDSLGYMVRPCPQPPPSSQKRKERKKRQDKLHRQTPKDPYRAKKAHTGLSMSIESRTEPMKI